ncbi:MAG: hypothetical protein HYV09_18275 [Deltaproteobacteria bacterium]|nr:hypothetical protein [Deltaproteobacteria bacterium]
MTRRLASLLAASTVTVSTVLLSAPALRAEEVPLQPEGTRLATNSYRIDLFQGPVLGGGRVTGLGGAYAPIAEGVAGFANNSASPAVRPLWSHSWFDFDWDLGVTFPNLLARTDFYNTGQQGLSYRNFFFATAGLNLQFGNWGVGFNVAGQTYSLGGVDAPSALQLQLARTTALLARSLFDGQLVIGAGVRIASFAFNATEGGSQKNLFSTTSAGSEAGVLVAPNKLPVRFALTARSVMNPDAPQDSPDLKRDGAGQAYVGGRNNWYLPTSVELPWEVEGGFALQLGPRPLNQPWVNTHHPPDEYLEETRLPDGGVIRKKNTSYVEKKVAEKYRALPRQKLLIVGSVLVSGPVKDAIGLESFLSQYVQRSGRRPVVTPRLGVEAEPFANAIQVRAGTYLEPSRFADRSPRLHGTLGLEVRLFRWNVFGLVDDDTSWRIGGYGDAARGYVNVGVTAGVWH